MLTIEQIKELRDKATKGPWTYWPLTKMQKKVGHLGPAVGKEDEENHFTIAECRKGHPFQTEDEANARMIAALPDIASTAIAALERVEELEKTLKESQEVAQVWCDRCYSLGYDPTRL